MILNSDDKQTLLRVARQAIEHRLQHGKELSIQPTDYPPPLRIPQATFVTLHVAGKLRGCIGILQPHYPLVQDVAQNAASAAFSDPRFPPLTMEELPNLGIEISILGTAEPVSFDSEADLLTQLRPGIDGLILEYRHHRGTFLPAVWETLPTPREFLNNLKRKAGLKEDFWSAEITVKRYTTLSIS